MLVSPESENMEKVTDFGPNFKTLPTNHQIRELQTIIRDKNTSRSDFVFYAERLIRLVVEEGLNQLPYTRYSVTTPTGGTYEGLKFLKGNCGVSIVRSGEAMEQGLRHCCQSIRIGKILVQSDEDTHEARVVYAKFPEDVSSRKVLLMYPIMSTGNTVVRAVAVLKEHGVHEDNIILLNLFCTPTGNLSLDYPVPTEPLPQIPDKMPSHSLLLQLYYLDNVCSSAATVIKAFPALTMLTSEVNPVAPNHFGQKYFGTD